MTNRYYDQAYATACSEKTLQSNEKGFFMQFVQHVRQSARDQWIESVFGKLQTDAERIAIIYTDNQVKDVVCGTLQHVQEIYRKKSADVALARRRDAEKLFRNGEIQKSLILYSQSVLRAPKTGSASSIDSGLSLAYALWGRSEVLMALKEYTLALNDIQFALKEGLPAEYKADAFWRMAICYLAKKETNRAQVAFGLAEKLITDCIKLEMLKMDKGRTYEEFDHDDRRVLPNVIGKIHPQFPNASSKLLVKEEVGKGRYVVADEPIKTGEFVVVEPPYSACLIPDTFGTHCQHCFDRLIAPVGCPDCANVAFCNTKCRDAALSVYHKFECKFLDLLIGSGMSILAHTGLRMITQNSLKRSLEISKNRSLEKVYSLCTNATERSNEDFLQRTLMAAFLLECLKKGGYFEKAEKDYSVVPTKEELAVGELLLFHLQMLQFNAHEIYETRHSPEHRFRYAKAAYIGVAIYPTVALFNHDCYPAVSRHFVGKNIVITALRPLLKGELIAENYGPIFTRRSLAERQRSLAARYWFNCACAACTQNWPSLDTGLDSVSRKLRCSTPNCSYFFSLPVPNEIMKCPRCKKKVVLTNNIMQMKVCEEQFALAINAMENQEVQRGIQISCQAIDTFHRVSCPPSRDASLGQEVLRALLADSGNSYQCELKTT